MLALLALIALIAIVVIGYKIIHKLNRWPFDPNHGQGTNAQDNVWAPLIPSLKAQADYVTITVPDGVTNLTVPVEALQWNWYYVVQTSSNLADWTPTDLAWPEALDQIRTNHNEPCRYYRRLLLW